MTAGWFHVPQNLLQEHQQQGDVTRMFIEALCAVYTDGAWMVGDDLVDQHKCTQILRLVGGLFTSKEWNVCGVTW